MTKLRTLSEPLAICRLQADAPLPAWAVAGSAAALISITRTPEEVSIVCPEGLLPPEGDGPIQAVERGWRGLAVVGPLDFALVGILASLAAPLAAASISIFVVSTFLTDYLLVRESDLPRTIEVLCRTGHEISPKPTPLNSGSDPPGPSGS